VSRAEIDAVERHWIGPTRLSLFRAEVSDFRRAD